MNRGYHLMAKPFGPICNIKCEYCFYLEKKSLFQENEKYKMSYEVLENYIKKYIETQDIPEISFVWQGGEPMLASLDFYKDVVKLQKNILVIKKLLIHYKLMDF
ncbi:arylsulfatase activating protein AslB [Brachyspira pilosicoli B2904]|uniref:Arylsulfatase activating protein AslB n=1 Tax=Brachyspira pilosicoli B2904 TaxID=1133568 RepID=J9UBW1_BRAPL|nr:radical SAM protein [Brachyspira pilosicoli]AFR69856.1 arylsulfatase activating protein AslB [Brachyspira pilosicoli B2904]